MSLCSYNTLSAGLAFAAGALSAMGGSLCIAGLEDGQGHLWADISCRKCYAMPARRSISKREKLIEATPRLGECFIEMQLLAQLRP